MPKYYIVKIERHDDEYFKVEAENAVEAQELMNRGLHAAYYSGVTALNVQNTHWEAVSVNGDIHPFQWREEAEQQRASHGVIDTCAREPEERYPVILCEKGCREDHIHIREGYIEDADDDGTCVTCNSGGL